MANVNIRQLEKSSKDGIRIVSSLDGQENFGAYLPEDIVSKVYYRERTNINSTAASGQYSININRPKVGDLVISDDRTIYTYSGNSNIWYIWSTPVDIVPITSENISE